MSAARKARGSATQAIAAEWYRTHGFPFCTDAGAGRQGRDLLNMIGLAGEVKGRADFQPLLWVRQASRNAAGDVPFVLLRCNGQGPAVIGDWPVIVRNEDWTRIIRAAGYGDPEQLPLACWEKQLVTEPFEQFLCTLPTGHDGPCVREELA